MPKGKAYNSKNVGAGGSKTPASVMGSQGKPVHVKPEHFKNRPTSTTTFEAGTAPRRKASGRGNPPNHGMKEGM